MINISSSHIIRGMAAMTAACMLAGCSDGGKITVADPVRVTVRAVAPGHTAGVRTFSGTVESSESSTVSFKVSGTITGIYVDEGQRVSRGQVLARVGDGDYVNAHNIASSALAEARDAYARMKKLHDADALPDIRWVEVQNTLKQAENAAEISARTLSDATLHSPVSGVVSRRIADVGQTVIAAEPVMEIVSASDLMMTVSVPEGEIGSIAEGQAATVRLGTLCIDSLAGRVSRKAVVADPLTRAYKVKISIPDAGGRILPGMVGEVRMAGTAVADSLTGTVLPSQAVLLGSDNRNFVWVVCGGKAERRYVSADDLTAGGVMVTGGLAPGDSVIVAGMQKVGTGTPVTCVAERSE